MHNNHPIITGLILGVALSWGVAKLNPPLVAHLTGIYPMRQQDAEVLAKGVLYYREKLQYCQGQKGA